MGNSSEQKPQERRHFSKRFWITLVVVAAVAVAITLIITLLTPPTGVFPDYIPSI